MERISRKEQIERTIANVKRIFGYGNEEFNEEYNRFVEERRPTESQKSDTEERDRQD